jgi:hypothetical protein
MSIIEEIAFKTIRSGGEEVQVEFRDGYEEIFPLSRPSGVSLGIRLESSSHEASSLRADLYGIAKKRRRITVGGDEYELRCRVYDSFGEDALRLEWRQVKPATKARRQKSRS